MLRVGRCAALHYLMWVQEGSRRQHIMGGWSTSTLSMTHLPKTACYQVRPYHDSACRYRWFPVSVYLAVAQVRCRYQGELPGQRRRHPCRHHRWHVLPLFITLTRAPLTTEKTTRATRAQSGIIFSPPRRNLDLSLSCRSLRVVCCTRPEILVPCSAYQVLTTKERYPGSS
ncbi:hypothetical protein FKP32DRAFT_818675 [Trametes sanguinea]|nr:hypothetical protein FKP32DRAFT_818675 [Trametes sanguinea]